MASLQSAESKREPQLRHIRLIAAALPSTADWVEQPLASATKATVGSNGSDSHPGQPSRVNCRRCIRRKRTKSLFVLTVFHLPPSAFILVSRLGKSRSRSRRISNVKPCIAVQHARTNARTHFRSCLDAKRSSFWLYLQFFFGCPSAPPCLIPIERRDDSQITNRPPHTRFIGSSVSLSLSFPSFIKVRKWVG